MNEEEVEEIKDWFLGRSKIYTKDGGVALQAFMDGIMLKISSKISAHLDEVFNSMDLNKNGEIGVSEIKVKFSFQSDEHAK